MSLSRHNRRLWTTAALTLCTLVPSAAVSQQKTLAPASPSSSGPETPVKSSGTSELDFDGYVPPGYHLETRRSQGLIASGAFVLGVPYMLSVVGAATTQNRTAEDYWLFVPVAGPWAALATQRPQPLGGVVSLFYKVDGVVQAVGAIMIAAGILATHDVLVRDDAPKRGANGRPTLSIAPAWFGPKMPGISLSLVLDGQQASR